MGRGLLLALVAAAAVVACGGGSVAKTPPSAKISQFCETTCARRHECNAAFDAGVCKTRCTTLEAVRKIEAFKPEATDAMLTCITANACDAELGIKARDCANGVARKLPVTPKAKAICAKLESAFADCGAPWATPCTAELSLFPESEIGIFEECANRQCRTGLHCFRDAEDSLLTRAH